eukprot:TRINITY_DN2350_c0_g1_i2.p1 TRINITY_DN2350_c0_g1~~TRINITY_DN2350_c0_g1_i2.p1  ORF type:complete len:206 (-),score=20.38 TRINITY_DN2350_c0_g1_i2:204-821(-)
MCIRDRYQRRVHGDECLSNEGILSSILGRDINCIIEAKEGNGGLYLGNVKAAKYVDHLKKLKISAVLTVANHCRISYKTDQIAEHLVIPAEDRERFDISEHFSNCIKFIERNLRQGRGVLVHCMAGVSRSAAIVVAFVIYSKGLSFEDAIALVRSKRSQIHPNLGFEMQLRSYGRAIVKRKDKTSERVSHPSLEPSQRQLRRLSP